MFLILLFLTSFITFLILLLDPHGLRVEIHAFLFLSSAFSILFFGILFAVILAKETKRRRKAQE